MGPEVLLKGNWDAPVLVPMHQDPKGVVEGSQLLKVSSDPQ